MEAEHKVKSDGKGPKKNEEAAGGQTVVREGRIVRMMRYDTV